MKKAVLSVLILLSLGSQAQNVTFSKHSRIVKTADTPEMATAAGILRRFLPEATGFTFPESQSPSARKGDILLRNFKGLPEDSFRIGTENGAVVLEPVGLSVSLSADGTSYEALGAIENPENRDGTIGFKSLEVAGEGNARYVKIKISGQKICPEWHYGVGNPCWFFADEVWVF